MPVDDRQNCPVSAQSKPQVSRTQVAYWRPRLEKNRSKAGGISPNYSIRIAFKGRRVRFPLNTPNKEVAASGAAKIFVFLVENGWEQTIRRFKPEQSEPSSPQHGDTVGDLIRTASKYSTAREKSKREYAKAFRRIAAQIAGIPDGEKYDAKSTRGGHATWQGKVDALKLSEITPAKVQAW